MPFRQMFTMHVRPQLKELYTSIGIFAFAFSLIVIFEPIFLYKQQFPIWAIALYYAIHYALYFILLPFGGKFASRFGLERSIVASLPFFVLYFISLSAIPQAPLAILVSLVSLTLHKTLYWPAYYTIFARFSDGNNRGTELSWLGAFQYGAGIGGPAIGALIASTWGFPTLFLFAGVLILFSGIPLMRIRHTYHITDFSYSSPWEMLRRVEYRKTFIATIGWGENLVDVVFWPLFLFVMWGNLGSLGLYLSISLLIMTIISFAIGDKAEKVPKERLLRTYLPFMIVGYFFRMFAFTPLRIVFTDSWARVSLASVMIPFMYKVYSQAKGTRSLEFVIAFEIVLALAKMTTALIIAFFFMVFPVYTAFVATFCLAALLSLFYWKL
jgi:MFS family permease